MHVYSFFFLLCLSTTSYTSSIVKEEGKGGKVTEKKPGRSYGKGGAPSDPLSPKGGPPTADKMPEKMPEKTPDKATEMPDKMSQMGIPVGEALDPPLCPPPPVTRSLGICYLEKCTSHHNCSDGAACCFNGCIRACTEPLPRPAAFDWVEDTSKVLPILGLDFEDPPQPFFPVPFEEQTPQYAAAEAGEELVHLPGGCYVSATRYQKLKEFMKAPSIKECRCDDGEVVCDIRTEKT